jgi:DNA alkylation damage repair protein AlkB
MHTQRLTEVIEGAILLERCLDLEEQRALLARCIEVGERAAGFYRPIVRGGGQMHVEMMCLGLHWNAKTYRYEQARSDHDGLPVQALPVELKQLAARIGAAAGMPVEPDLCIVNRYSATGRMGLHQDKDESPETLRAGTPIVSLSIGDTARFLFGGFRRKDPALVISLRSGDAFVFGGPSRLRYHGVARIEPNTAPPELGMEGRFNLTFRQYSLETNG